mmetsp:Transcript_27013/g.37996  ORF Transcript_27013/g.37996 Transcript_27013/m.37996 type:complete len:168 (+) Transcript_27013:100-603(+)
MKYIASFVALLFVTVSEAFAPFPARSTTKKMMTSSVSSPSSTSIQMGLFDGIAKAFGNEEYGAPPDAVKATARHILVKAPEDADLVLGKIAEGTSTFAELARQYSTCPSGSSGGSLGSFSPGTMVAEFDKVIFSPDTNIGEIYGPVQTQFGYHLIVVDKRTGGGDWY